MNDRVVAFDRHPDCMMLIDRSGRIFDANRRACEILGYSFDELCSMSVRDLFARPAENNRFPTDNRPLTAETVLVVYMIPKTGPIDAAEGTLRMTPMTTESHEFGLAEWQSTVSKATHEALLMERHRYRSLFEQAHDAVFLLDLDGRYLEVNNRAARLLGYTVDEFQDLTADDVSAEPDSTTAVLASLLAGQALAPYEQMFRRKDGSTVPVEINMELVRDGYGRPMHIQSLVRDVTGRKAAQEKIRKLLAEKEVLLREVHHRVKNSMATVISMLEMEAADSNEPNVREALDNVGRRLRSMEQVYKALSDSADHSSVDLRAHLDTLLDLVSESLGLGDRVVLERRLATVEVPSRTAFSLGVVLNELLTNACKYAFPDSRRGKVRVELQRRGDEARLTVKDDGVGSSGPARPGFGTVMMETLIEQIGGRAEHASGNGTTTTISFPLVLTAVDDGASGEES